MIGVHSKERKFKDTVVSGKNGFAILYGRRGCERAALMTSFATGTNSIYYCAASASDVKQQELFGKVVMERYSLLHEPADYADAFSMIELRESADLLIAIDKAENILKKDSVFLESLCAFISKCKIKVHVFFATEDVPFVTGDFLKLVAGHKDLYLGECRIEELTFLEMVRLFSNKPTREIIQMYGITGGVPDYLPCWNPKLSLKDNIIRSVLSPRGYLFNEAEEFLHTQLRETSVYETILSTLASGVNKLNDIYKATGFSRAKISVYMKNLAAFGVASKQDSFETGGWENAKKGMYVINDTFLHFWFTFVYPHQSELHILPPATFYERYIEPDLDYYMDEYFVKVCREYLELLEQAESLPIVTAKEGTWIGKNGRIDIILQNDIRENVVGYCSWSDRHMSLAHLEHLNNSMEQARVKAVKRYMFSSGVFDDDLKAAAADDPTLELVDMNEL